MVTAVPIAADGSFAATFPMESLPKEAFFENDPFLTVQGFTLTGKITSADGFCGSVSGYAQILGPLFGMSPSDRIRLEGSTFGATRISGDALPTPVSACAASGTQGGAPRNAM